MRFHSVVSYNPALFENSLTMDWYAFEKLIFSYRLDEGSIPDFTQENEQRLSAFLLTRKELLTGGNIQEITGMLIEFFRAAAVDVNIETEELNLAQFRQLPDSGTTSSSRSAESGQEPGIVLLQVEFLEDKNGKEASRLGEGEVVLSKITDTRDIAHYLAHLIGGKREDGMIPLPSSVRRVAAAGDGCEVQVYLAPGVVGITKVSNELRVKVMEMKSNPWWKKILPW